jgi:GNAT superfamily N-acetyltransferase
MTATIALVDGDAAIATREAVFNGLRAFNRQHAVPPERRPLVLAARSPDDSLIAGLVGETAWRWAFVDLLWVDEAHRRHGLGRRLLTAAEDEARHRDCVGVYLDTFDFQARPFYERQGYTVFGILEDYPVGHRRFYMQKRFLERTHSENTHGRE